VLLAMALSQRGTQAGQVLGHGAVQRVQAVHRRLRALGFFLAQRAQLGAPDAGEFGHARALGVGPLGLRGHARAHQRF
jgi:hypothetical protein